MVKKRVIEIEVFRVHGPSAVFFYQLFAYKPRPQHIHRFFKGEFLV
jgi:hypothetical protein